MAVSLGQPAVVSRHDGMRSHHFIGLHNLIRQSCRQLRAPSIIRQRPALQCKSFKDEKPSNDERERQNSSLEASCSGQQGTTPAYHYPRAATEFIKNLGSCFGHSNNYFGVASCPPECAGAADQPNGPQQRWQLASWLHSRRQGTGLRLLGILGASAGLLGMPCLSASSRSSKAGIMPASRDCAPVASLLSDMTRCDSNDYHTWSCLLIFQCI